MLRSTRSAERPRRRHGTLGTWILLIFTLAVFLGPPLVRGEVIYPSDNRAEAGGSVRAPSELDMWYQDVITLYVPETAAHLRGNHDAWLATWNPHNELGRPLFQTGVGPAFVLARIVSWATRDPFVHYTWMAVLSVILTALFTCGFLLARGLHPLAAWAGAVGLSIGPLFPGWSMVPLVQWGFCWTFGSLLFFELWLRGGRRWNLVALAFCVHAILLTGFPQHALGLGWIVAGWMVLRVVSESSDWRTRARRIGTLVLVSALAIVAVLPCLLDLHLAWKQSTRADDVIPWSELFQSIPLSKLFYTPSGFGSDIGPVSYSLGPVYASLALVGALRWRERWSRYWSVWALALVLGCRFFGFSRIFLALGMSFSEWSPVYLLHVPAVILAAHGADSLLSAQAPRWVRAGLAPRSLRSAFLALLVVTAISGIPQKLLAWQPRATIKTDSKVAQTLRYATADGSRFALVGPRPVNRSWLPPNIEMVFGLRSLHSYYHTPSRAFHRWVRPLRQPKGEREYERRFLHIAQSAAIGDELLALSGVSTLVSFAPLPSGLTGESRHVGDVNIAALTEPGPLQAILPLATLDSLDDTGAHVSTEVVRGHAFDGRLDTGVHDRLEFRFDPSEEQRVLFLSQQYHPHWEASGGGSELATVRINDLFQGVVVPAGASSVELRFLPNAPWIWVTQALFAAALVGALAQFAFAATRRRAQRR